MDGVIIEIDLSDPTNPTGCIKRPDGTRELFLLYWSDTTLTSDTEKSPVAIMLQESSDNAQS